MAKPNHPWEQLPDEPPEAYRPTPTVQQVTSSCFEQLSMVESVNLIDQRFRFCSLGSAIGTTVPEKWSNAVKIGVLWSRESTQAYRELPFVFSIGKKGVT
jgi:hypothetical protein